MYVRSLDASINLGTTYRSAVSTYILEILTKQDNSQKVSKILCSRESEFLQYGTEIKKMFPNAKFTVFSQSSGSIDPPTTELHPKISPFWEKVTVFLI